MSPALHTAASGGSFLITPDVGLMLWTLLLFVIAVFVLGRFAFPRITEALDKRQHAIEDSIDHAEKVTRKLLSEDDQKRLVQEALSELDFSPLTSGNAA